MAEKLRPHFEDVQAHYDLSDEFFALFLDPSQTYSCAYFEKDDYTLEQAQQAKVDLALGKLGLKPGMTLLDVGCGWGSTMRRAVEKYDVNVIGLTLSKNQAGHVQKTLDAMDSPRTKEVRLAGWEQFNEPVDRIVSIGAFEHFGHDRYDDFFTMANNALPDDGVMLLHTITGLTIPQMAERGMPLTFEVARFFKFIYHRDLPRRPAAVDRDGRRPLLEGRLHADPPAVAAAALCEDSGLLGRRARGAQGRSHRDPVAGNVRPLHALSDRLREWIPGRIHRCQPIHPGEIVSTRTMNSDVAMADGEAGVLCSRDLGAVISQAVGKG